MPRGCSGLPVAGFVRVCAQGTRYCIGRSLVWGQARVVVNAKEGVARPCQRFSYSVVTYTGVVMSAAKQS